MKNKQEIFLSEEEKDVVETLSYILGNETFSLVDPPGKDGDVFLNGKTRKKVSVRHVVKTLVSEWRDSCIDGLSGVEKDVLRELLEKLA